MFTPITLCMFPTKSQVGAYIMYLLLLLRRVLLLFLKYYYYCNILLKYGRWEKIYKKICVCVCVCVCAAELLFILYNICRHTDWPLRTVGGRERRERVDRNSIIYLRSVSCRRIPQPMFLRFLNDRKTRKQEHYKCAFVFSLPLRAL